MYSYPKVYRERERGGRGGKRPAILIDVLSYVLIHTYVDVPSRLFYDFETGARISATPVIAYYYN